MKLQKKSSGSQIRARKAKSAPGLKHEEALLLKKRIEEDTLSHEDLLKLLGAAQQSCDLYDKSCTGRKENPNCLCGLIPAPGRFRRKGLWQKDPEAVVSLGANPADGRRQRSSTPSGLNNLGNTCYVNSALQCLFMIRAFREGLFAVEDPIGELPVISHIRRLFAQLQEGAQNSADPTAFAESLNLDRSYQQDGQEFFKLLLNLLEAKLTRSDKKLVKNLVPNMFRGSYFYETVCMLCGRLSEGSGRVTNFYELDAQVKGQSSLEGSLASLLGEECLEDDNQYFCNFCQSKVNARRQMKLESLPPYLCISLQRFIFDMKKMSKVKASDKLSFPLTLELGPLLALSGGCGVKEDYELMSILIHKGPSASHGHYVAHVWDEEARSWWRFDDEIVTEMPKGPLGEHGDHGVAPEKKGGASATKGKRKSAGAAPAEDEPEVVEVAEVPADDPDVMNISEPAEAASPPPAAGPQSDPKARIVSGNAYMLVYRRHGLQSSTPTEGPTQLPPKLAELMAEEKAAFDKACAEYEAKRAEMVAKVQQRQSIIRQIVVSARIPQPDAESRWISAKWLQHWVDTDAPEAVDNQPLLCQHGKLNPNTVTEGRRIAVEAWRHLQQECGGGPELADGDVCQECLAQKLQGVADAQQGSLERDAVLQIVNTLSEETEKGQFRQPGPEDFYVCKPWLTGWKKRQSSSMKAASPTEGITCPHGGLLPEVAGARARRIAVPPVVWEHLRANWHPLENGSRTSPKRSPSPSGSAGAAATADRRVQKLDAREAAVAVREQRMGGGMDAEILQATLDAIPKDQKDSSGKQGGLADGALTAREAILEMREAAVAAKEAERGLSSEMQDEADRAAADVGTSDNGVHEQNGHVSAEPRERGITEPMCLDTDEVQQQQQPADTARQKGNVTPNGHAEACPEQIDLSSEDGEAEEQPGKAKSLREFRVGEASECPVCLLELRADASTDQHLKAKAGLQRNELSQLAAGTALHMEPGSDYALLPRPWLTVWRAFVAAAGRRTSGAAQEPGPLPRAVADAFCACHPGNDEQPALLNVPPPAVVRRRGRWVQAHAEGDAFEPVDLADWTKLMAFYGEDSSLSDTHPARRPIKATLVAEVVQPVEKDAKEAADASEPAAAEAPVVPEETKLAQPSAARGNDDTAVGHFVTDPDWCRQAVAERESTLRAEQLSYSDAVFHVEMTQASEVAAPAVIPTAAGERRSKRVRRGKATVTVSAINTLWDLKLRIMEALSVHPRNADVYCLAGGRWKQLESDEATLAELGVGLGQVLKVVHAGLVSDDDYASIVGGPEEPVAAASRATERGFAGTALVGL